MRRCLSSLLLLAMLMTSAGPLLALAPQNVPACCRANGNHHCAANVQLNGDGFRAQGTGCPFRQSPAALRTHAALRNGTVLLEVAASRSEVNFETVNRPALQSSYALPKRGPPTA